MSADAEGRLDQIRLKLTDVPDCCEGCSWQLSIDQEAVAFDGEATADVVCCGCGESLTMRLPDDEDEEGDNGYA